MNRARRVLSWIIALLGLWEAGDIALPFAIGPGNVQVFVWNHILVGIALVIVGVRAGTTSEVGVVEAMDWAAAVAGLWLIIASFTLGSPEIAAGLWNDVAVGAIVLILSLASRALLRRRG